MLCTSVPWQRCQFHLQQNAQSYIARLDQRKTIGIRIRSICRLGRII